MKTLLVAVCLFGLSACTPEQIAAVEDAYRASIEADRASDGPTWSVDADCNGAHVVLTGWTGVTDVSPSTGVTYAVLGVGSMVTAVHFNDLGSADEYHPTAYPHAPGDAWGWSLLINGVGGPLLNVGGVANC